MFIHSVVMMVHVFSSSLVTDKLHYLHTNMNKDWVEYVSGQKNGKILCLYLHIKYYKTVQYCLLHLSVYLTLHTFFFMISIWLKFCGTEMNKKMTAFDVWIYMYVNVYKWTTLMVLVVVGWKTQTFWWTHWKYGTNWFQKLCILCLLLISSNSVVTRDKENPGLIPW